MKKKSRFPLVDIPSLFAVAKRRRGSECILVLQPIIESYSTTSMVFSKPFKVESVTQARLQLLREILLRITK